MPVYLWKFSMSILHDFKQYRSFTLVHPLQLFSFFHLVQFSILCHFRLYLVTVLDHHKQFPNVCHLPNPFSLKLCITSSDVFTFIVRSLRSDFYTYLFQFSLLYLFKQVFTQLLTPSKFPFLPFYLFTYCYQLSR